MVPGGSPGRIELSGLFEELKKNRDSGIYPYHMPGHKRQPCGELSKELCGMDITEIDGFDNLHQPEGMLLRLEQVAAKLYGAEESFYLVNGSTSGVLCALSAALPRGGHVLMARNCHKSAYHGAYLRNLKITYLYPSLYQTLEFFDQVEPLQVKSALETEPDINAVLLVSPTYEGRIQNIRAIADIAHAKGIPLIVDEAHGAHLGFGGVSPENSCHAGADLVIHSIHKTLPALTQAALLHVNGDLIDRQMLRRFLQIYQTSSPSYLLMASIDNALRFVEQEGDEAFGRFARLYGEMLKRLKTCKYLRIVPWDRQHQDIGKLVISVAEAGISGRELYDILLHEYGLQLEMACASYVLAMFTVNDSPEGYERMTAALLEIDGQLANKAGSVSLLWRGDTTKTRDASCIWKQFPNLPTDIIPMSEAWDMDTEEILLEESAGRYAGDFVNLYPPGVPVLVPGERFTKQLCQEVKSWLDAGLMVQGVRHQDDKIFVKVLVKE